MNTYVHEYGFSYVIILFDKSLLGGEAVAKRREDWLMEFESMWKL